MLRVIRLNMAQDCSTPELQLPSNSTTQDGTAELQTYGLDYNHMLAMADPIAVCGMAFRLPGGIANDDVFWDLLIDQKDARTKMPKSRFNVDAFYSESSKTGTIGTQYGYFLEDDPFALDTAFFSVSKSELQGMDPQQRLLLEVTRECLENAGEVGWRGKPIGCYVGNFGEDWQDLCTKDAQDAKTKNVSGYMDFAISNRISYEFDFKGPSMTIKTACSSSLIGLHQACQALRSGDCSSAIVAGTNIMLSPTNLIAMSQQGVLSHDGSCKTFDASGDGYARGEAINCVYLKSLSTAVRDKNPIRAVIRGSGVNFDGKTTNLSTPSSTAQEALIRHVYQQAGLNSDDTAFVECHGTGTAVGDPIETKAVAACFRNGAWIGSVKPNVGHSEGASGLTSLIKSILALERSTIPPNTKFSDPNPAIKFSQWRLKVPTEPTAWPTSLPHRISINSFGIGGANAHVVVERSDHGLNGVSTARQENTRLVLPFSAHHPVSLQSLVKSHRSYAQTYPDRISDLAFTLGARREHLPYRAFCLAKQGSNVLSHTSIALEPSRKHGKLVYVFTGQAAQWPEMGKELLETNDVFRNTMISLDDYLSRTPHPPSWSIVDELQRPAESSRLGSAEFSQPLCTAIQIALVDCLRTVEIVPEAVLGHSSGEIAAAYAAGALSARDAIVVAYYRGFACRNQTRAGSMAAIGLGWSATAEYLEPNCVIACDNSPTSVTISGDPDAVERTVGKVRLDRPDTFARILQVDKAYHSFHMLEVSQRYHDLLQGAIESRTPRTSLFSSVYEEAQAFGAEYWQKNLERPVRFQQAVRVALNRCGRDAVLLEIGPHSTFQGPLRQIFSSCDASMATYIPSLIRNKDCEESLLNCIGHLYTSGFDLDFDKLIADGRVLTDLPSYPWNHQSSYWHESRIVKSWKHCKFAHHDLLGIRVVESPDTEPIWRNLLSLDNVPWLRDHKIRDDIIMPSAGYIGMVTEALKQVSGTSQSYSLRNVLIKRALLLQESTQLELVTTLSPQRLTDQLESRWWHFTISSLSGTTWVRHCVGEARPNATPDSAIVEVTAHARHVDHSRWYKVMRKAGLNYGANLALQRTITASPSRNCASASIDNNIDPQYLVHPTSIDQMLQLFTVSSTHGLARKLRKLVLPSAFDEIEIRQAPAKILLQAEVESRQKEHFTGTGHGTDTLGNVVITLKGVHFKPAKDDAQAQCDPHALAQLSWRPQIMFLEPRTLFKRLPSRQEGFFLINRMTALIVIEFARKLEKLKINMLSGELGKYLRWIVTQKSCLEHNTFPYIEDGPGLTALSSLERQALVWNIRRSLPKFKDATEATGPILALYDNIDALLLGESDAMGLLFSSNVVTKMYNVMYNVDQSDFLRALAHEIPHMRILEIGAGTGGATTNVLSALVHKDTALATYSAYVFTDVSAGFFGAARERFNYAPNLEFGILDISQDPLEQGFEPGSFDLVVAANVVHVTPKLVESLRNIKTLLKHDGRLLLQELCPSARWLNFVFGVLPGWWNGAEDDRAEQPFVAPERWERELIQAGFEGLEAVIYDDVDAARINALMVARPKSLAPYINGVAVRQVSLLVRDEDDASVAFIQQQLVAAGMNVVVFTLGGTKEVGSTHSDVISLLDFPKPFFSGVAVDQFEVLQRFITMLSSSERGLIWVTAPTATNVTNPEYAEALGFARVLRSEMILDIATFQISMEDLLGSNALLRIVETFGSRKAKPAADHIDVDYEYLYQNGQIFTSRYHPVIFEHTLQGQIAKTSSVRLQIEEPGILSSLQWTSSSPHSLDAEEIEVEMKAIGMNFKDILIAMGIIGSDYDGLGLEGAGVVVRIGTAVTGLRKGDRVMLMGFETFATRCRTHQDLCVRLPDDLSFEEAATMPCVYATAIRALMDVGGLEDGQSVLIHSACGGVGIAAIQICQMVGADIYATVGNNEKAQYLQKHFGLPREHIFQSRNASFLQEILATTSGQGVDLVLNSLSGELLHASWKCVAPFGKMVEIGKRDLIGRGTLALDVFEANRTYAAVDLTAICSDRPKQARKLLERTLKHYAEGHIRPIPIAKQFAAADVQNCFRSMQKGEHIGKIIVTMPEDVSSVEVSSSLEDLKLSSDATYLLVGGFGGLGRSVAVWMAEHGARSFTFMSPSAGKREADAKFIFELEDMGCTVQLMAGCIERRADVEEALTKTPSTKPLKGILQMSMFLRDRPYLQMSYQEWQEATNYRVKGTWNLHNATIAAEIDLDFFVLFSSISGIIGNRGQANYAAANAFLDAFVPFRRQLLLPCSAIDIGMMEDVGALVEHPEIAKTLKAQGNWPVHEEQLLDALRLAIGDQYGTNDSQKRSTSSNSHYTEIRGTHPVLGLRSATLLSSPENRTVWKRDARFSYYHQPGLYQSSNTTSTGKGNANSPVIRTILQDTAADPSILSQPGTLQVLSKEVALKLLDLLLKPSSGIADENFKDVSLAELGLDSLIAIEVRNWWRHTFGFEISMLDLLASETVGDLAGKAIAGLRSKHGKGDAPNSEE